MSLHEAKDADTMHDVTVATNMQAVASGMEWDAEERKNVSSAAAAAASSAAASAAGEYELSAQIDGHDYGVRDVAASGTDIIASMEEKGRASIFHRSGPSSWTRQEAIDSQIHAGLAFVLANVEGCRMKGEARGGSAHQYYPMGTFMSGGADKAARPFTANGTTFNSLTDHTGPVNSISRTHPERYILTGSWDGIVRVWDGDQLLKKFDKLGHEHGTEVLGLENGTIVTASTNKHIVIVDASGKVVKKIANAHNAPIRKLIAHPLGFASAANDGLVKVWSEEGDAIQTIEAAVASEVKFLYGVCFLPGGNPLSASVDLESSRLVTCGEDGFVRIFSVTGRLLQELGHPGPVRSVTPLGIEGDFMTACTDKKVRVFTKVAQRFASEKERAEFKEIAALVKASGMKGIDTSTLENEDALKQPGKKNGQVKVVNVAGRSVPIAYQWSDDLHEWIEIGEAMGASGSNGPSRGKAKLDGKEYDFVSDIWLTEEQKVQLGFNADDDPTEVTDRFCALYQIPADMRQQIYEFVEPKIDQERLAMRRSAAMQVDATPRVVLQQVPSWTTGSFETYTGANHQAMETKLIQTNAQMVQGKNPHGVTGDELKTFRVLLENLKDTMAYHSAGFSAGEIAIVKKMVQWPTEHVLAVMDAMRVLMLHLAANAALGGDAQVHTHLLAHVQASRATGKETHQILMLKIVSNWLAKRQRSQGERSDPPTVPKDVVDYLSAVLAAMEPAAGAESSENLATAYVMLLHNIVLWLGRIKLAESELYPQIASGLCDLLHHKRSQKIQFYALLTIGSIAYASTAARDQLKATFSPTFTAFIAEATKADNAALKQVANDCQILFQLK